MRKLVRILGALALLWLAFAGVVYALMAGPPGRFAAAMAKIQYPVFVLLPFQTLWNSARGGALHPGDTAPDFRLSTVDKTSSVSLSSFRGVKPVVLVFGSYT
jgi:hypothetical protein